MEKGAERRLRGGERSEYREEKSGAKSGEKCGKGEQRKERAEGRLGGTNPKPSFLDRSSRALFIYHSIVGITGPIACKKDSSILQLACAFRFTA